MDGKNFYRAWVTFIIFVAMCMVVKCSYAQDYTREGTTFKASKTPGAVKTKYTWVDSNGTEYPIYLTAKSCYVIKVSKKDGKEYKKYLPEVFKEIQKSDGKSRTAKADSTVVSKTRKR